MSRIILTILTTGIIFLFLNGACKPSSYEHRLDEVDKLNADYPDSSLKLLATIDSSKLDEYSGARYRLLKVEARYKSGYNDTCIDNMRHAYDILQIKGNRMDKAKSAFYMGILQKNNENITESLISFLKCLSQLESDTVHHTLKAHAFQGVGDCFLRIFDCASSLEYYKKAFKEFKLQKRKDYILYGQLEVADAYFNCQEYDSCIMVANEVFMNENSDTTLKGYALQSIATSLMCQDKYPEAIDTFLRMFKLTPHLATNTDSISLGVSYYSAGLFAELKEWRNEIKSNGGDTNWLDYLVSLHGGDYKQAVKSLDTEKQRIDSVSQIDMHRNLAFVLDNYYKTEKLNDSLVISNMRYRVAAISVVCILLAVLGAIIIVALRKRHRQKVGEFSILTDILNKSIDKRCRLA